MSVSTFIMAGIAAVTGQSPVPAPSHENLKIFESYLSAMRKGEVARERSPFAADAYLSTAGAKAGKNPYVDFSQAVSACSFSRYLSQFHGGQASSFTAELKCESGSPLVLTVEMYAGRINTMVWGDTPALLVPPPPPAPSKQSPR
ncbi:hypothetical protein K9B35_13205 [Sphingomonas sp. R647]|uniref:hypothetical protein n=1 Tax=Sphingomonas sp. R647 TaxID=2875233 RepID=UPI001CD53DC0|nr:hypothetical protein [Sphingomonas sp. R647]MCA1198928.1 hypothetical protein [Sphingomonas sp. R647]